MMKVAMVGLGGMGSGHYNLYRQMEDVELVGLADVELDRVAGKAAECGARAYSSLTELLANESPDVVDICTPSYTHIDLAVEAMNRGCHVLTEKPAALCAEDVRRAYTCARENGVRFMAAHVIRFWGEYVWLKDTVEKGTLGRLRHLRLWRTGEKPRSSWQNWMLDEKKSGMVPFDLHIHDVDYMVYLLGLPEKVESFEIRGGAVTNYIQSSYRYPEGLEVTAEAGWYSAPLPFNMGYEAIFEGGIAVFRDNLLTLYPNDGTARVVDLNAAEGDMGINLSRSDGYYNEIRYFLSCVENGVEPERVREQELLDVIALLKREHAESYGK